MTGTSPEQRVCKDEIFGPVTVVEPVDDFEAGLAACNASRFGIQAAVFTRDLGRALTAFRELDFPGVLINDAPSFRVDNVPYGGVRDSGQRPRRRALRDRRVYGAEAAEPARSVVSDVHLQPRNVLHFFFGLVVGGLGGGGGGRFRGGGRRWF